MYELLIELGTEALLLVAYSLGTLALSLIGLAAEYNSLQQFLGGDRVLAVWFAVMGVVALAFAVNLGREKLLPRVASSD
jgi:GTP cyclohydrolase III